MKHLIIILIFLSSQSIFADTPTELTKLRSLRDKEIKKIDISYVKALKKLKTKFTKRGDLTSAISIDDEIKLFSSEAIKNNSNINERSKLDGENFKIEGTWIVHTGNKKYVRKFNKTKLVDQNGDKHSYEIKDGVITITWSYGGGWEKLKINNDDPDLLLGTNTGNDNFIYKRQK